MDIFYSIEYTQVFLQSGDFAERRVFQGWYMLKEIMVRGVLMKEKFVKPVREVIAFIPFLCKNETNFCSRKLTKNNL